MNVSQDDGFQSLQAKQDATNKIQEECGPCISGRSLFR